VLRDWVVRVVISVNLFRWTSLCALFVLAVSCAGQEELFDLGLEELLAIEVTTANKRLQPVGEIPAAVTVITAEDIRRSRAQDLPELLQRVPGFHVGRIHGGLKAIGARTNAIRLSNKLLVLIDGRSVYTPVFSGVYWEQQHIMLQNIERIEVIRGPGGALWGANAVNGIVNVITKDAADTLGGLVTGSVGSDRRSTAFRYGTSINDDVDLRLYANGLDEDAGVFYGGSNDDWRQWRFGARADGRGDDLRWTLEAEVSQTTQGAVNRIPDAGANFPSFEVITDDENTAAHVLGRLVHTCDNGDELTLQGYWDFTETDPQTGLYRQHTFDLDVQRHMRLGERQELVVGLGYRLIMDDVDSGEVVRMMPEQRRLNWYSAFAQHELELIDDLLKLTSGLKAEYNDYTHDEWQPSVRLSYTPREHLTLWFGWSRAARTPSRFENDVLFRQLALNNTGDYLEFYGSEDFESEYLHAWEGGVRCLPDESLMVDLAVYYHDYDNQRTFERVGNSFPDSFRFVADNRMHGEAYGAELSLIWRPTARQRYYLAYTYAEAQFHLDSDSFDAGISENGENEFPHHQVFLAADWELTKKLDFGVNVRYVDNAVAEGLGSRVHLDARVAWRPLENLELAVVGQSLLDPSHPEFGVLPTISSETTEERRSISATLSWTF
jgi:iron complex outermembrane receptor protein